MDNSRKYKVGDVVTLKSGGPAMTVNDYQVTSSGDLEVHCCWFSADNEIRFTCFSESAVKAGEKQ
jgi:uncharacterized protein YodC (DUF2158 family)